MLNPCISIIVPIYQEETNLCRCLNSILSQTFEEIEVLLIDDGSEDRSREICEEYARADSRVRFFSKPHSGVSDTRQLGMNYAVGEYVIYCDSDDWIENNMLETLYKNAKETDADVVVCDYWIEYREKRKVHKEFSEKFVSSKDICGQLQNFSFCLWNKLIRRTYIVQNNLRFLPNIYYAEDLYLNFMLLNLRPHISYIQQPFYHYDRRNEKSLTHNIFYECFNSHKKVLENLSGHLNDTLNIVLNKRKCIFLYNAFKSKYFPIAELRNTFPEVHKYILPLIIEHYEKKVSHAIHNWVKKF